MRILVYIFTITLLFIVLMFLLLSYVSPNTSPTLSSQRSTSFAILYFKPDTLTYIPELKNYSTTIFLDTHSTPVSSVQIELSYNPDVFYDVNIIPAQNNLFGKERDFTVALQDVRQEYGRASLALELNNNQLEVAGNRPIGVLTFKAIPGTGSATITFLNKSAVSERLSRTSLLQTALPFTFQLYP